MLSLLIAASTVVQPPVLRQELEPLAFLVGYCWRGEFEGGTLDIHCFETVFDGQHIRDRHEVTGSSGTYRGETLYSADPTGAIVFTYWNSEGGLSRGTMRAQPERLNFGDEAYRDPDGRRINLTTHWRRIGEDAYEAVTHSAEASAMNRIVRYQKVIQSDVTISEFRGPDGLHNLVHEAVIDAPVQSVWSAVSTAEGWQTWAVPVAWQIEPDVIESSYTGTARPGDGSTIRQQILARIPGRLIAFRTVRAPDGFPNFDSFRQTLSVIELEPEGENRTRLRLTGVGYPNTDAGRQLLGFFREGNRVSLNRLRSRFVDGPLDWNERR